MLSQEDPWANHLKRSRLSKELEHSSESSAWGLEEGPCYVIAPVNAPPKVLISRLDHIYTMLDQGRIKLFALMLGEDL